MDLPYLIEQLYETGKEVHSLSREENKNTWTNLLSLIKSLDAGEIRYSQNENEKEIRKRLLKDSNLFLLCRSPEQEEYLQFLQIRMAERGLSLKNGLTDQQMIEAGLGFVIILLLEKQMACFYKKQDQSPQSGLPKICKVINYDYFEDNNTNEDQQRYEDVMINDTVQQSHENQFTKEERIPSGLLDQYLCYSPLSSDSHTHTPLKPSINHNIAPKLEKECHSISNPENQETPISDRITFKTDEYCNQEEFKQEQHVALSSGHIQNLSILFYRFFESFTQTYEHFALQSSPNLSHYFLNIISQHGRNFSLNPQTKAANKENLSEVGMTNTSTKSQNYTSPFNMKTPDAMKMIENNQVTISDNKENTEYDDNPVTTYFQTSEVYQKTDLVRNFFERNQTSTKKRGHSIDHTGQQFVESPTSHKKTIAQKRPERCVSWAFKGYESFEESKVLIRTLDKEKRIYEQYCKEQSQQIEVIHGMYLELKEKYDSITCMYINQLKFDKEMILSMSSQEENFLGSTREGHREISKLLFQDTGNCQKKHKITQSDNLLMSQRKQDRDNNSLFQKEAELFESGLYESSTFDDQSPDQIKTSECNPITMGQTLPKNQGGFRCLENDSDVHRRQSHNNIIKESFLFQSTNINCNDPYPQEQEFEELYLPSEENLNLFDYVTISDISKHKLRSSITSMKSALSDSRENSQKQMPKIEILKLIAVCSFIFFEFYIMYQRFFA